MFQSFGQMLLLLWRTAAALPTLWRHRREWALQLYEMGNASLFMACFLSLFIGGVLALQTGPVLADRGLNSFMGGLIGLSICRELAPVLMAMLIAGRVGSAMAAELGSMQVYQEIDALKTMNIDPVEYLVVPRLAAICCALPMLVVFSIMTAWTGGALVCVYNPEIGITFQNYFGDMKNVIGMTDIANGLCKSAVFAVIIGIASCHYGFATQGGPREIGRSVTKAVIHSLAMILIFDYFVTRFLMVFD